MLFSSCHKDINESKIVDTRIPGPEIVNQFDGDLTVLLTDLGGVPIPNADIYVYDNTGVSDKEGVAVFKNIPLDKTGTHVKALREGYLFGSVTFNPTGLENFVVVKMLPIQNMATFNSSDNVSISIQGGGEIKIEPGIFEYSDGTVYNGEISLLSQNFDTEGSDYTHSIPGDHTGLAINGSTKALEMHSTVAVFAFDEEGASLFIGEDKSIIISMPVNDIKFDLVPETIQAWSYNEVAASWMEKEIAFKDENSYLLEVNNLGFWACAKSSNFKNLTGRVLSSSGKGLSHLTVILRNEFSVATAFTDSEGKFYTKVPEGIEMTIEVSHPACGDPLYFEKVESLSNAYELEDIVLNTDGIQDIIGFINCNMESVPNGLVYCKTDYYTYVLQADENGLFNIFLAEAICNSELQIQVFGLDPDNEKESVTSSYEYNTLSDLYIDVCADCAFQISVEDEILDNCDLLVELTVTATQGSGDYSYKWEDGSAGQSVTVTENQEFCLTVTDNVTGCEVTGCKSFVAPDELLGNTGAVEMIDCDNYGFIEINMSGGKLPHNFIWAGPSAYSNDVPVISDLIVPGTYVYTVTDGNGCTFEGAEIIEDFSANFALDVYTADLNNVICDENSKMLFLNCGGCGLDLSNAIWELPGGGFETGSEIVADEAGIYQVSFSALNCYAEGSIQLQKAIFDEPVVEFNCIGDGNYEPVVTNLQSGFSDSWSIIEEEELILEFESQSFAELIINSPYASCSKNYQIELPQFNGFNLVSANNTSCDVCADGSINIEIDEQNCSSCVFEDYYIYRGDNFETDLKLENSQENLEEGIYYVVAKSAEGCILNSLVVFIE